MNPAFSVVFFTTLAGIGQGAGLNLGVGDADTKRPERLLRAESGLADEVDDGGGVLIGQERHGGSGRSSLFGETGDVRFRQLRSRTSVSERGLQFQDVLRGLAEERELVCGIDQLAGEVRQVQL